MFDAKRLLDQFLGSGAGTPGAQGGQAGAQGGQAQGGQFDLGGLLSGRTSGGVTGGGAGGIGDMLGGLAGGGFGKGAMVGGLAGLLLGGGKKPRKLAGSALTYGGLAVAGALAYKAWQDWQAGQAPGASAAQTAPGQDPLPPPPADTPFSPATAESEQRMGLALVRAMIAAAKADGHIDAEEQKRIFGQIEQADLDGEAKAFVLDELARPLDIDAVAAAATSPEEAAEIYAASLMAIDPDDPAERGYLAMLAGRLKLDPALVEHLHANVKALG